MARREQELERELLALRQEVSRLRRTVDRGVWFVHGWDWDAYPIGVFADELSARRCSDELGYGEVVFWRYGIEWSEVHK